MFKGPVDSHSVLSGYSRTSKFYVKEVKDRKITLRVRADILSKIMALCSYVLSGCPVDHADSSDSNLYSSYHGDGKFTCDRKLSLILTRFKLREGFN